MGKPVLIYGKSGSGKSRSMKNFEKDEILFVNVERKDLPFKGKFKYTLESYDYNVIKAQLSKMPLKSAVIDDCGYLMTTMFMERHSAGLKGGAVYDLYNDIGDQFWSLIQYIKRNLPDDVIVYIMMHEDTSENNGDVKLKTIGKLLDNQVNIQGMVTICLRCMSENGRHFFRTVTDGFDITKSPEEMFESEEIENDLKAVDTAIRKYYEIESEEQ